MVIRFKVLLALLVALIACSPHPICAEPQGSSIGQHFSGEHHTYSLGFWIFDDVATAELSIERRGVHYVATLRAYTKGFVDRLRHREDTYTAIMEEVEGGKRFRTLRFEKEIRVGKKHKRTITILDYEQGIIRWEKWRSNRLIKKGSLRIPEGVSYDCPLTAFYNMRYGVYGPLKEGAQYSIMSLPKEDGREIKLHMRVLPRSAIGRDRLKHLKGKRLPEGYLYIDATIPKELFNSRTGKMEIVLTPDHIPLLAVARDVLLFGDVWGRLVKPKVDSD